MDHIDGNDLTKLIARLELENQRANIHKEIKESVLKEVRVLFREMWEDRMKFHAEFSHKGILGYRSYTVTHEHEVGYPEVGDSIVQNITAENPISAIEIFKRDKAVKKVVYPLKVSWSTGKKSYTLIERKTKK